MAGVNSQAQLHSEDSRLHKTVSSKRNTSSQAAIPAGLSVSNDRRDAPAYHAT